MTLLEGCGFVGGGVSLGVSFGTSDVYANPSLSPFSAACGSKCKAISYGSSAMPICSLL